MGSPAEADAGRHRFGLPHIARIGLLVGVLVVAAVIVVVASSSGTAGFLSSGPTGTTSAPRVSGPSPDFSLQDISGKTVSLAGARGRPVIINFWATWCPPCKAEMPAINAVAQAHPDTVVLAVDVMEGPALVHDYLTTMPLGFSPLLDPNGTVAGQYHVSSLPSSFFIGPDGIIRAINVGPMDQPTIEQNVRRAQS